MDPAAPRYSYSTDEESFQGDYATREEAATAGRAAYLDGDPESDDPFSIQTAVATRRPIADVLPSDDYLANFVLDEARDLLEEESGDDPPDWIDAPAAAVADLGAALGGVVRDWFAKHVPPVPLWDVDTIVTHHYRAPRIENAADGIEP